MREAEYGNSLPVLKQLYALRFSVRHDLFRPQRNVYLADVRLAQEKHTDTGLADASSDGIGKLPVKYGFLERKIPAVFAAGFLKLDLQSLLVHTDTHGGKLEGNIQYRIVYKDVAVQLPVVIVRGASVVALSVA